MRYLAFLIATITLAQGPVTRSGYLVSTLPSASANNKAVRIITDGVDATDCTVGSGLTVNFCRSNGSAWVIISTGTSLGYTPFNVANNLSEGVAATMRTNLGLGTAALISSTCSGDLSGTLPGCTVVKVNGIAYSATAAAHSVEVITSANTTASAKIIPDCTDILGNHLNFTQSTDAFSCGSSDILALLSNGSIQLPTAVTLPTARDLARTCATCSTTVDLYTPASGHQAIVAGCTFSNTGANSVNFVPKVKISGSYFALGAVTAIASAGASSTIGIGLVLDSTMTLAVFFSDGATSTLTTSCDVKDFVTPSSGPRIRSIIVTTFINGDNTIYTVPAATTAYILDSRTVPGAMQPNATTALLYTNNTGGARVIQWNLVPSGGAVSATGNAITSSASVSDGAARNLSFVGTLATGDFLSMNTNANTAGQVAWLTVAEQ